MTTYTDSHGMAYTAASAASVVRFEAMLLAFIGFRRDMMKQVAASGHLPQEKRSLVFELDVPAERRPEESRLEIRYSPTLAMAMVDASCPLTVGSPCQLSIPGVAPWIRWAARLSESPVDPPAGGG